MKFTRVKTTVMAGLVAASMLAPGMTALADEPIKAQSGLTFKKTVEVASGVTIPDTTLSFKAAQIDSDDDVTGYQNADGTTQPKTVGDVTLSFSTTSLADVASNTNKEYFKNFSELESQLTLAGEYTFQLTETSTSDLTEDGYGWTMNTGNNSYYLHAYVTNEDGKLAYQYLVTTSNGVTTDDKGNVSYNGKVGSDSFSFTNKYTKKGGSVPSPDPDKPGEDDKTPEGSLVISKVVDGDSSAYSGDTYEFTVTFTGSTTETIDGDTSYTYKIGDVERTWKTTAKTISLKNGEKAVFDNIPAGVSVSVVETKNANTKNTNTFAQFNGAADWTEEENSTNLTVSGTIGEKANRIKFVNTYKDVTVTGVVTSVAPYITLVVVAVAAVAAYVAMKTRVAR